MKTWIDVTAIVIACLYIAACTTPVPEPTVVPFEHDRIVHRGQPVFLSGMNLAWITYGNDLTGLNEAEYRRALDEIRGSGGNSIRWWIHVNGSRTPLWDGDSVVGMPAGSIETLEHALDMAWERGLVVVLSLWSFDMLQEQSLMDPERNKRFLEDDESFQTYLDNALTPIVEALADHPAIVAWEVYNEPEGMTSEFGWTPVRTDMATVQKTVNRTAGTIHRLAPDALVTSGTWNLRANTDIEGFTNYYRDDRLIAAGGDELGTLDVYQVHFYPHFSDSTSPFHNPAVHWGLDKPILVGEFAAVGITDTGTGMNVSSELSPEEAYNYLFDNGYAGALAWTWTAHEPQYGSVANIEGAMLGLRFRHRDVIDVNIGEIDTMPRRIADVDRVLVQIDSPPLTNVVNLAEVFTDREDGENLRYVVHQNSLSDVVIPRIEGPNLSFDFVEGNSGTGEVVIRALDASENRADVTIPIAVIDPNRGNVAIFKETEASTIEQEAHLAEYVNDGLFSTRWSSVYEDNQWLEIDLDGRFTLDRVVLHWEAAHGLVYDLQVSTDRESWTTVFSQDQGSGGSEEISFEPIEAAYVRLDASRRATEWGFSLWEMEAHGERVQ